MIIRVTREDIDKANSIRMEKPFSDECPIYLATKKVFPHLDLAAVGCLEFVSTEGDYSEIPLPPGATKRMLKWDTSGEMSPFEFEIETP
jgi:hypothetical protein